MVHRRSNPHEEAPRLVVPLAEAKLLWSHVEHLCMRAMLALALVMIGGCSGSKVPRSVAPNPPQAVPSIATVRPVLSSDAPPRDEPAPTAVKPEAAPEPRASEPTVPEEAVAHARTAPGTAFACQGALYIATRSGEAK